MVLLHIFGRSRPWEHEWLWAFYQFNFVTVMLGPIVAGLGTWDAQKTIRARWLIDGSNRRFGPVAATWAAVMAWTVFTYAFGVTVVSVLVKMAGTPGLPEPRVWSVLVPALALLGAEVAFGVLVGWYVQSPLASPAVAVAVFLISLFLYTEGPTQLITVGGATASLFGLASRWSLQIAQTIGFTAIAVMCLSLAAWWRGGRRRARRSFGLLGVGIGVGGVAVIVAQGPQLLQERDEGVVCFGSAPEVCAGPGYSQSLEASHNALGPYLEQLESAGIAVPTSFVQGVEPGEITVGPLSTRFIQGDKDLAPVLVINTFLSKSCDLATNSDALTAASSLQAWLEYRVSGETDAVSAPQIGPGADGLQSDDEWVKGAIETITQCR